MRKLILLDKDGSLTEVDPKALHREALELKAYIDSTTPEEARQFGYKTKLLPLVDSALNGTLKIPYKGEPYNIRLIMEGLEPELPSEARRRYVAFLLRIQGDPPPYPLGWPIGEDGRFVPDLTDANGNRYRWIEFED